MLSQHNQPHRRWPLASPSSPPTQLATRCHRRIPAATPGFVMTGIFIVFARLPDSRVITIWNQIRISLRSPDLKRQTGLAPTSLCLCFNSSHIFIFDHHNKPPFLIIIMGKDKAVVERTPDVPTDDDDGESFLRICRFWGKMWGHLAV